MSRRKLIALSITVLALLLAACQAATPAAPSDTSAEEAAPTEAAAEEGATEGTNEEGGEMASGELPEVNPLEVEGNVILAGSSTVFPLAEVIVDRFVDEGYGGLITIDKIGSGAGFERFCEAGETDISNASRPIKEGEVTNCQSIGRDPIEFRIGTDALAVAINPENDWVTDVTLEELATIFTAENWSDVNPDWPAEPIQRFIPGTDSGTFDYFVEEIFEEDPEPLLATNPDMSEEDNVLVQGIQESQYAIGFFGYAYYEENQDVLSVLSIDGVEPSAESVDAGEYLLARPLFMYSSASIIQEKPQVAAFLNFVLTTVNDEISRVGYFPADESVLDEARAKLSEAMAQ